MNGRTLLGLAGFGMLAVAACGGTETGNPPMTIEIALSATSTDPNAAAVRSTDAALNVEAAWFSVRRIELEPCSSDAAAIGTDDYPLDLADETPARAVFESNVRDYCGVTLEIGPSADAEPPELEALSVHVLGTRSDGVPFEIASTLTQSLVLETALAGTPFDARHITLGVDLATWFAGADVHGATATNGVALIDATTNVAVLTAFDANTVLAVALYADPDRDGIVDTDELVPIATGH